MYQPGGARLRLAVTVARMLLPPCETMSRSTRRWLPSKEWVVTPFLMRFAHRIAPACGDAIARVSPYAHRSGTLEITGRGPRNR